MKMIALVPFLVGAAMVGYALTLDAYQEESIYRQHLSSITYGDDAGFADLRATSLTSKYRLQDYGITLMATGAIVFLTTRNGNNGIKAPGSRVVMILIAATLPTLTIAGAVFEMMQAFNRGDYPPWGDAVMIPLLGLPFVFVPLLLWSLMHLGVFWPHGKQHSAPLALALSRQANWWLLVVSAITAGLTLYFATLGYWWMVLPGVGWLYYYLSLAANRHSLRDLAVA